MKLATLKLRSWIGVRELDLAATAPITLFVGKNGAGKTSVSQAIETALTGAFRRVSLKKDLAALVSDGAKTGMAVVETDIGAGTYELPKGTHGCSLKLDGLHAPALPFVLDMHRFSGLSETERRKFLFGLTGVSLSDAEIEKRLLAKDVGADQVKAVLPIRAKLGFDAAAKHAAEQASQARGAWKAVTGEAYGSSKGAAWKLEAPAGYDPEAYGRAQQQLREARQALGEAQTRLGQLQAAQQAATTYQARLDAAKACAEGEEEAQKAVAEAQAVVNGASAKLAVTEREHSTAAQLLKDAQRQAEGWNKVEVPALLGKASALLHEVYEMTSNVDWRMSFEAWRIDFNAAYPPARCAAPVPSEVAANEGKARQNVAKAQAALLEAQNALAPLQRKLDAIKQAQGNLEALQAAAPEQVAPGTLEETTGRVQCLKDSILGLEDSSRDLLGIEQQALRATSATGEAFKHHMAVLAWDHAAKALAPDGIPGEIVAEALGPINNTLKRIAELSGWETVKIGADMAVTADGRLLELLNKALHWKVDAMLTMAIAAESGLRFVMLDDVDHVTPSVRAELIYLCDDLVTEGVLHGAALFMATEQAPSGLPESVQVVALANGRLAA